MATITRLYGWDCGNLMIPAADNNGCDLSATIKKTGGYSLRVPYGGLYCRIPMSATVSPSISAWIMPYGSSFSYTNTMYLRFLLGTGEYIDIRWNATTHTFDAYVNGALVAAGTVAVAVNDWFHVQFYVVIADAGSIQVKINGRLSIDYSGDTQPADATTATYFYMSNNNNPDAFYVDDLAIGYGGFLGDIRCIDIRPNADTAQDDWTPSAGDNYSTIDEAPPSDADYNEVNTNAQADELALSDFDGATYNPVAVTAWVRAQMLAATGDSIKVGIDSGGTDDVTEHALSTTWAYYFHTADLNPADAAEWEDADIDALLLRYESVIA